MQGTSDPAYDRDGIPALSVTIRPVGVERPWRWLASAASDFMRAPGVCLAYGAVVVLVSLVLTVGLWWVGLIHWLLPLLGGFFLVGPIIATGLYDVSRRLEKGERPTLRSAVTAWQANTVQIALMGVILMLFFLFWVRLATLLFALFFGAYPPGLEAFVAELVSWQGLGLLLVGTAIGAVLALLAYAISVISIPMLLDRPTNVLEAIVGSLRAVAKSLPAMLIWAGLIVIFTLAGFATFYVGLVLIYPLLGLASWHCYRDIVGEAE